MAAPKIDRYQFGRITIDGREYTHDVIIYPDWVDCRWWREEGHSLSPADLAGMLQAPPEVLVIGQGSAAGWRCRLRHGSGCRKPGLR